MPITPARAASTVVLIRPSRPSFEVLLVKRHDNVAFMGGAHVFPGGRVDTTDHISEPERFCDGVAHATARLADLDRAAAVGHYVAAIRELFEEAGVLLVRPVDIDRLSSLRRAMLANELTLKQLAGRERFRLAFDALVPFAHWVTPAIETKRFDARFFVAVLPDGQSPTHDEHETIESEWMEAHAAVERCRRDEIQLPPPTWTTLRMLSKLSSVDDVVAWARQRPIVRIEPRFIQNEIETMLTLPGDSTFPPIEGFDIPEETRFILTDGRWKATT